MCELSVQGCIDAARAGTRDTDRYCGRQVPSAERRVTEFTNVSNELADSSETWAPVNLDPHWLAPQSSWHVRRAGRRVLWHAAVARDAAAGSRVLAAAQIRCTRRALAAYAD